MTAQQSTTLVRFTSICSHPGKLFSLFTLTTLLVFGHHLLYAADAPKDNGNEVNKTSDQPVLTGKSTLFKIRVRQYSQDISPKFYHVSDKERKNAVHAPKGIVLDIIGKQEDERYVAVANDYRGEDNEIRTEVYKPECTKYVCINRAYTIASKDIEQGYGLLKDSIVSGMLIVPYKYYPDKNIITSGGFTVAPYFGYEHDSIFGMNFGLVQKYTLFAALGPTFVSTEDSTTKQTTNSYAIAGAIGFAYDINQQIKLLFVAGKDWTGNTATPYTYNSLPWLSVTLGASF